MSEINITGIDRTAYRNMMAGIDEKNTKCAEYCWIITEDHIMQGSEHSNERMTGPRNASDKSLDLVLSEGIKFRMLDGDKNVYYTGKIYHTDGPDECDFQPLDDFGTPNAGCVSIEYLINDRWEAI
jgi:hypothetical protein